MTQQNLPGLEDCAPIVDLIPAGVLDLVGIPQAVPVLEVKWHDERCGCELGHRYDAHEVEGTPEQYQACRAYRAGGCKINGRPDRDSCLFHLPETAPAWVNLRRWVLLELPDGSTALTTPYSAPMVAADMGARIVGAVEVRV